MPTFEQEVSVEVKIELDAFDVVDAFADEIEDLLDAIDIEAMIDFLREKGCDLAQGYLFSYPLTPENLEKFALDHGSA